ncbi:hypothetical protein GW17_00049635 [Ensete ventricosum]|nr:hypothetical protein GW17_00049635 [Ensete ventricosum]
MGQGHGSPCRINGHGLGCISSVGHATDDPGRSCKQSHLATDTRRSATSGRGKLRVAPHHATEAMQSAVSPTSGSRCMPAAASQRPARAEPVRRPRLCMSQPRAGDRNRGRN